MKTYELLNSIIMEFNRSGWTEELHGLLLENPSYFMTNTKVLNALVEGAIGHSGNEHPAEAAILEVLIDEARMQIENEGEFGDHFLNGLKTILADKAKKNKLSPLAIGILTSCYARANIAVPDILLSLRIDQMEKDAKYQPEGMPDFNKLFKGLVKDVGGDLYGLFEGLSEMLAGIPEDAKLVTVHEISSLNHVASWSMAAYWFLSPSIAIREQAALAILQRTKIGEFNGTFVRQLPMLRSWMQPDTAQSLVDEIIREVRRKNFTPSKLEKTPKIIRICATPADGSGSQSLAIITKRKIGMVLTKSRFGVKDAFVIPCRGTQEIMAIQQQFEDMGSFDITLETVSHIVAAALAESIENNQSPAFGLINIVSSFGIEDVRPHRVTLKSMLEELDGEGIIKAMSPQKRGRVISQAGEDVDDLEIINSWFEDNPLVRDILQSTEDTFRQEKKLISYLDSRREYWAERFLKAAIVIKDNGGEWLGLTVTAGALLDGRSIAKTPLMSLIVYNTMDAYYAQFGLYPE